MSKYSHQSAPATAMPSTAAATTPASTSIPAPTPTPTIDSPKALITNRPRHSPTAPGTSVQPSRPDRDDRLAQGDDHDQPVALGEVAGHELPALRAEQVRPDHVQAERDRPHHSTGQAVEERPAQQEPNPDGGAHREAGHRPGE